MGQQRVVARLADGVEALVERVRRVEVGGFDQQRVAGGADGHDAAFLEAFGEEGVKHVFGGEVEADGSAVGGAHLVEGALQLFGGVGDVLHDVGGEPHGRHAQLLVGL